LLVISRTTSLTTHCYWLVKLTFITLLSHFTISNGLHIYQGSPWLWSYGSWIYNYLCNECLSPLTLWVRTPFMTRCTRYNIMWVSLSMTWERSVVFSGYSGFLHQKNWPQRYSWNIVESGVKHHQTIKQLFLSY
jgi:hypothetical protein